MLVDPHHFDGYPVHSLSSSSLHDVDYSCGSCGYDLNLNSCNRNTSVIGSKYYGKSIKKGIISFLSIDETRFSRTQQLRCKPYFESARSWGIFQRRTKLLCRKCGNYVGNDRNFSNFGRSHSSKQKDISPDTTGSWGWNGDSDAAGTYDIRIRALQPSSCDESNIFSNDI
ncbi:uncharacterized protein At4g08330, chloroplastic-like [Chenopodium quinoa]|uniref:Uncharacterized protein n=1 Tax=Chenopodium quinoa TaxID=63459 RepID=A0A803L4X0_CHEQI|nr:uncharacterized protein At4g08330, chloroplastic-like [Chenopodium quinoa]